MELFFKLCTSAVTQARGNAELWNWSAMEFWEALETADRHDYRSKARCVRNRGGES